MAMRSAITIRALAGNPDMLAGVSFLSSADHYRRCFGRAAEHGFAAVQPYLQPEGYFSLAASTEQIRSVAKAAAAAGVAISSLEIEPFSYLFTADDPAVRARAVEVVSRAIEVAAEMEAGAVLVIPGWVGLPWDKSAPVVRYDLAYDRTIAGLRAVVPAAERHGVTVMVENIWNRFLLSPLEMRDLIDTIGSPRVGAILDTGNVVLTGYPEQWIRILGSRLHEVHLKDFRTGVGHLEGFVGLFEGDVNWPEVMAALAEINYDGYLTVEAFPYLHNPDLILTQAASSVAALLAMAPA